MYTAVLLACLNLFTHPFHVSVYDIVYDQETDAVQVTCRIFLDDLELALQKENGNEDLNIVKDSLLTHTTNKLYFQKNFKLSVNGNAVKHEYLGGEIEQDVIWIYLEVKDVEVLKSISLSNTILTDVYDDQQNMVHFKIDGDRRSFILTESETIAELLIGN